jgi:hypothetical protein
MEFDCSTDDFELHPSASEQSLEMGKFNIPFDSYT